MSPDPLQPIREALQAGDRKSAQALLRPLLNAQPSAESWYLAAQACSTNEKAITCLHRALALDSHHNGAKRLLRKLEDAQLPNVVAEHEQPALEFLAPSEPLKQVKHKRRFTRRRVIVLLFLLLMSTSCSLVTMNLVGVISGPLTAVTELTGGGTPVTQINGVPLSQVIDAPLKVQPSQSKPLQERNTDVIEPGYEHEYTFVGHSNEDVAIYVQFLSVGANKVSRNVVILRPNNSDATPNCQHDTIVQGDNNIALLCTLDASGTWKVRILGRTGESVGAYFVGEQGMES